MQKAAPNQHLSSTQADLYVKTSTQAPPKQTQMLVKFIKKSGPKQHQTASKKVRFGYVLMYIDFSQKCALKYSSEER